MNFTKKNVCESIYLFRAKNKFIHALGNFEQFSLLKFKTYNNRIFRGKSFAYKVFYNKNKKNEMFHCA